MLNTELRRKAAWLIAVRAVISTTLLGSATFVQVTTPGAPSGNVFFFLVGLTYALTIVYAASLRYVDRHPWLVELQLGADALIVSAFIDVTGGVASYFSLLYVLPIVAGSALQLRRGGLLVATLSSLLYLGVVLLQYAGADEAAAARLPSSSVAQYTVVVHTGTFFVIAVLSGSLAAELQSTGARLRQASSDIADLQALNQHVINSLPSGLVTTDAAHRVLTFNRAAEAITGLEWTAAAGRPVGEVLQLPREVFESLEGELAGRPARRCEITYRTHDGRGDIALGLTAAYLVTPGGRAGLLFTFQDVTTIKKLERDAAMRQRLAAVGEMAAAIAHEIRNPLASMSGSIQILRQELPLTAEQEQLMDIVLRESERLNATIRSFLAYARPQRFAIARVDVRRALNDTALLLRNSAETTDRHVIEVDVPPHELWYDADEHQIRQIIWNLATNGIRAMAAGGRLRLAAAADSETGGVVLEVADEGIGMSPEEVAGLFQPFHGRFAKGSGLGLAIVHRIVTDYKGEIQVSSAPGAGTTVAVRLPAERPVAAA